MTLPTGEFTLSTTVAPLHNQFKSKRREMNTRSLQIGKPTRRTTVASLHIQLELALLRIVVPHLRTTAVTIPLAGSEKV